MKILTKVLVGSRLHGLNRPDSDYDWRGIHIHPLKEVLSPWGKVKNTTWIEGDEDNTSYELADFCKQATHGNATILEVFFSDQIKETSPIAEEMRANWQKFMGTDRFVMASRGYAQNQFNKMNLFEPDARTPKFAVAYLRVLWQCAEFLRTGQFFCQINDEQFKNYLLQVKHEWDDSMIPELTERFMALQGAVSKHWAKAPKMTADIPWIEDFIYRAYAATEPETIITSNQFLP